jgi:hypothetical protein
MDFASAHMKLAAYMAFFVYHILSCYFGSFFIIVYMVVCFVCLCLILYIMYFYCYVYVFFLSCMFCSVYSVFIAPSDTLRLPLTDVFLCFSSVVRQIPGYNSQRQGMACTLLN